MAEQTSTPKTITEFTYRDEKFAVTRKPSAFLLVKLAKVDDGDPSAMGVMVDFFRRVLSPEEYARFERIALDDDAEIEDSFKLLGEALQEVISGTLARPTK